MRSGDTGENGPDSDEPDSIRAAMKQRGFTLGGGYGSWKETTFRIGHMGDISIDALNAMLDVLGEVNASLSSRA